MAAGRDAWPRGRSILGFCDSRRISGIEFVASIALKLAYSPALAAWMRCSSSRSSTGTSVAERFFASTNRRCCALSSIPTNGSGSPKIDRSIGMRAGSTPVRHPLHRHGCRWSGNARLRRHPSRSARSSHLASVNASARCGTTTRKEQDIYGISATAGIVKPPPAGLRPG